MLYQCPVEGCKHMGTVITKVHYRNVHNLEREKAEKKYGKPTIAKKGFCRKNEKKTV